MEDFFQRSMAW